MVSRHHLRQLFLWTAFTLCLAAWAALRAHGSGPRVDGLLIVALVLQTWAHLLRSMRR